MANLFVLPPNEKVNLSRIDPKDTGQFQSKEDIAEEMDKLKVELEALQEKLVAGKKKAVIFVFQGMDCSGKDGSIKHVFSGLNPQGVYSHSFKSPSEEEKQHDFLWRAHNKVPPLGYIATFNRSYYEEVLITRVHGTVSDKEAKQRFKHINNFESMLADSNVKVVKIFLHISKEFQLEKLKSRIEDPNKNWKFDPSDLAERKSWDHYQSCYEKLFKNCSSSAPWHIVPSDNRWYRNYAVLKIAVEALKSMHLKDPKPIPELQLYLDEITKEAEIVEKPKAFKNKEKEKDKDQDMEKNKDQDKENVNV
ncbi:PPK2 family polyphosphate:nucleotide phosphotransferase [Paenibacillus castaneae]|uniref:PPK2 family polyphosphate kinase n=1 Tax=Paenibacillus castaneae TaxID=474957 RepID=UPI000C9A9CDB|nr:PPK2 family polyphosphate kinase [Paenibacillus castaneae]NIK78823.1 PPK2 family polyphosphate:nucleotide phosphotransferase [Paenibacillus castaneae]